MAVIRTHGGGLLQAGFVCLALAGLLVIKALVPKWRTKGGWGRSGSIPISAWGHIGIAVALILPGIGSFAQYYGIVGERAGFSGLVGFAVFMITGFLDNRNREKKSDTA